MSTMSPELALVDPELRAHAVASLPPIYVNAFLEVRPSASPRPVERRPSVIPSAALTYLLVAVVRTLLFEAVVFAAVFTVVLIANLFA